MTVYVTKVNFQADAQFCSLNNLAATAFILFTGGCPIKYRCLDKYVSFVKQYSKQNACFSSSGTFIKQVEL